MQMDRDVLRGGGGDKDVQVNKGRIDLNIATAYRVFESIKDNAAHEQLPAKTAQSRT